MTLFKNKYRIESARLKGWDYSNPGLYFVTICTHNRGCFFGDVVDGEMHLSPIGEIVAEEWQKTPTIRPNVMLDEWVVMPNHVHGIVVIGDTVETPRRGVSTGRGVSTNANWKPNSLGSIINQFKLICTKRIWALGNSDFRWQARFYDHIVRNERELNEIRNYILGNPSKWDADRNNPSDLWM